MSKYRYPGVKPFETSEANRFFGRERDLNDFYRLIALEKLVVLFGKSGYGKSSLLNAGIIPRFAAEPMEQEGDNGEIQQVNYLPVVVRFGNFIAGQTSEPLARVFEKFSLQFSKPASESSFWDTFPADQPLPLWYLFKKYGATHVVLLFDQFEEFFSYPPEQQYAFRGQLAELLYTRIPQFVRDQWTSFKTEKNFLSRPMDVKAVFAIRSDRMSELDKLKDELPAILHKRYELKALTLEQAREAVTRPAALPKFEGFVSAPFGYENAALNRMFSELSTSEQGAPAGIEAFQLQVLCQHFEQEIIRGKIRDEVKLADLPDIAHIFETYYKSQLSQLDPATQPAAQAIIEEGLLYDDPATGEARRLSVDADQLVQQFRHRGTTPELLRQLENTFLLRREANNLGRYNYEISHDTLVAPILKNKRAHEALRKQREAEEKAKEAEQNARAERARAEEMERLKETAENNAAQARVSQQRAEKNARRANLVALLAIGLTLTSIYFWYESQQLRKEADLRADEARLSATKANANALRADSLLRIAEAARTSDSLSTLKAERSADKAQAALAQQLLAEAKARKDQFDRYRSEAQNFRSQKRYTDAINAYRNARQLAASQAEKDVLESAIRQCQIDEKDDLFQRSRDIGLSMKAVNDCVGALRYLRKALEIRPNDKTVKDAIAECEKK